MRHLHQNTRAIARVHFRAARAAVVEIDEHLQTLRHDVVRLPPLHVSDKSDAACVMFKLRVVEPLFWW